MASPESPTPVSGESGAPPMRSGVSAAGLSVVEFAALLPLLAVALYERGSEWLWVLIAAVAAALICQRIFAEGRGRRFVPDGIVAAIACAIVLPVTTPLWQVAIALAFGIVVGQEIFGGRGWNFLNVGTVALAFFIFSFPGRPLEILSPVMGLAVVPGAVLLLAAGLMSPRVLIGAFAGLLLTAAAMVGEPASVAPVSASFVFALVFFAADPVSAASTNQGRSIYGVFFGGLVALLSRGGAATVETAVFAALISGVFAPLIDTVVVQLNVYRRGRRHG